MAKRSKTLGGNSRDRPRGRRLVYAERQQILGVWSQLSDQARLDLLRTLTSMMQAPPDIPEIRSAGRVSTQATSLVERQGIANQGGEVRDLQVVPRPPHVPIWEREILRDIPEVQRFGQLSAPERGADRLGSRSMSIATGVVARGRREGIPDNVIGAEISRLWNDPDTLITLYRPVPDTPKEGITEVPVETPAIAGTLTSVEALPGPQLPVNVQDSLVAQLPFSRATAESGRAEGGLKRAYVRFNSPDDAKGRLESDSEEEKGPSGPPPSTSASTHATGGTQQSPPTKKKKVFQKKQLPQKKK